MKKQPDIFQSKTRTKKVKVQRNRANDGKPSKYQDKLENDRVTYMGDMISAVAYDYWEKVLGKQIKKRLLSNELEPVKKELQGIVDEIPDTLGAKVEWGGRSYSKQEIVEFIESLNDIIYEPIDEMSNEMSISEHHDALVECLKGPMVTHFKEQFGPAIERALFNLLVESMWVGLKILGDQYCGTYQPSVSLKLLSEENDNRLIELFDIKAGHRKVEKWFCCPMHFQEALSEELRRFRKASLIKRLDKHMYCQRQPIDTTKSTDNKTLNNWLQKIGYKNLDDVWEQIQFPTN
jgi:hypothetical protein